MSRPLLPRELAGVAVMIVAGLGLGFGVGGAWRADPSLAGREPAAPGASSLSYDLVEQPRSAPKDPQPAEHAPTRRALLIGVTKYDHLPRAQQLAGPANDARDMRQLLEQRYRFPADGIVILSETEGRADRRPTRQNIEREFRMLAEQAREGDQVVVLMAGHGSQQPESDPPDAAYPEPDGLDEIFLPADVKPWQGAVERLPGAIIDDEIGAWLRAITAKKAYVWTIFDCCHSGTMTRGTELVREIPPQELVPPEELARARDRAAARGERTRGGPSEEPASFAPRQPTEYLVATYACRPQETTPECLQPRTAPRPEYHGLLTYTLVDVLTKSAESDAPLTYRDLVRRLQTQYAGRPQGSPTPLAEGKGQDRIVLGTEQPARSPLVLTRQGDEYRVNAGDLYGLTPQSVLAVESSGAEGKPRLLGHVKVVATRPSDATVEPCAFEGSALESDLPPFSSCRPVFIDYRLPRLILAIQVPQDQPIARRQIARAVEALTDDRGGLAVLVDDPAKADWLVRLEQGKVTLVEASANRPPFALPAADQPALGEALRTSLEKVYRARNLVAISTQFEGERYRGNSAAKFDVEVLRHKAKSSADLGEPLPEPDGGWVFRSSDLISFRIHNRSQMRLDVTLLVVGSDFEIQAFYPQSSEVGQSLDPGKPLSTPAPWGEISDAPPFGPECLVVIATPATNPPADFTPLAQAGLALARGADPRRSLQSPLGELLESAMFRTGGRRGLGRAVAEQHGMRILTWRTEPK